MGLNIPTPSPYETSDFLCSNTVIRTKSKNLSFNKAQTEARKRSVCDLVNDRIIRRDPDIVTGKYKCYLLHNATGSLYITADSPQFISGHCRVLGRKNGQYPFRYMQLLEEMFGRSSSEKIEVCSGWVKNRPDLMTVDVNPDRHPSYVGDAQCLPNEWENRFYQWYGDPPYSERTASEKYNTGLPKWTKLLAEGARVVKPGGLLFLLMGNKNLQSHPKELIKIGWIVLSIIPNQESRAIHCYLKKPDIVTGISNQKNAPSHIQTLTTFL